MVLPLIRMLNTKFPVECGDKMSVETKKNEWKSFLMWIFMIIIIKMKLVVVAVFIYIFFPSSLLIIKVIFARWQRTFFLQWIQIATNHDFLTFCRFIFVRFLFISQIRPFQQCCNTRTFSSNYEMNELAKNKSYTF